tara:strand:- start:498 stop:1061 length:564 start_codon:yes stop_codon:yes gene_type:complete
MAVIEAYKTTRLEADAASVTFSNFDVSVGPYNHLFIHYSAASTTTSGDTKSINVQVNDITGSYYQFYQMYGRATSVGAFTSGNTSTRSSFITTRQKSVGYMGGTPAQYGAGVIFIPDPLSANKFTTMQSVGGKAPPESGRGQSGLTAGNFNNAGAGTLNKTVNVILSPETGSWLRGSAFTVYGLVTA